MPHDVLVRKEIFDELNQVLWEVDVTPPDSNDFRFLLFTDTYKKVVGIGHDEMAGKTLQDVLSAEDFPAVHGKYSQCVNSRLQITYSEHLNIGGQLRWWLTTMRPKFNEQGQVYRLLGTSTEIVGIERNLRNAIADGDLAVHYQPIFDLSGPTPTVAGYEALIRWPHSGYSPADFLPVAKESGLMPDITNQVLIDAAGHLQESQGKRWIAVNVSDCIQADQLSTVIDQFKLNPDWLRFEITEDTQITEPIILEYSRIIDLGCLFELDDYGTDRSNAGWLSHIPIQVLKLEAQFVANAWQQPNKAAICRSASALAESYSPRLDVIAEGIETQKDLEFVRSLGFRYGQGYLLGRPRPWGCATIDEAARYGKYRTASNHNLEDS